LPQDPPVEEADVERIPERVDEEEPEDGGRDGDEAVSPPGFAQADAEHRRAGWRGCLARGRHGGECPPAVPRTLAPVFQLPRSNPSAPRRRRRASTRPTCRRR